MSFTLQDIQNHVAELQKQGLSGDALYSRMYEDAKKFGVSLDQIDQAMGYAPGTSQQWSNNRIANHVAALQDQGLSGDDLYRRMYNDAQTAGVSMGEIDQAMGYDSGTAQQWVNQNARPSTPQTGLIGAESALEAGTTSALSTLGQGAETARDDLTAANTTAQQQVTASKDEIANAALRANDIAQDQIQGGKDQVVNAALYTNDLAQNYLGGGRDDVLRAAAFTQAAGSAPLSGFNTAGLMANARQAALSGAMGNEAQQQAFNDFSSSPGQQYLRDQAEKALLRNSAAIGGLGGGNVRTALQDQAVGMAAQDFNNYYNRLADVSNRGAQAGQGMSSLTNSVGNNLANQLGGLSTQRANVAGGLGGQVISSLGGLTGQGVGVTGNLGGNVLNQFGSANNLGINLNANTGQNMANVAQNTGINAANLLSGAGNNLANYRYDTGLNLANTLNSGSAQLATLNQNQGISQADLMNQYATNIANLLGGTGTQMATSDQTLAALNANIATGAGSQYAGLSSIPGVQTGNDHVTSGGNLLAGIGAGAEALQGLM